MGMGCVYKSLSTCGLPAESGWSSRAPACWAQAETEPQRWPPLGRHSYWHTACRSSLGWEVPPAPDTTASLERLNETSVPSVFTFTPNTYMQTSNNKQAKYILPYQEHWGQRDSLGSSTGLLGASAHSLHQCLQALWKSKTQHVSYTQWPQEGSLLPSLQILHALWQSHCYCTPNRPQMWPGSWEYSLFAVLIWNKPKTE